MTKQNQSASLFTIEPEQQAEPAARPPLYLFAIAAAVAVPILVTGWSSSAFAQSSEGSESDGPSGPSGTGNSGDGPGHGDASPGAFSGVQTSSAGDLNGMMGGDGGERVIVIDVRPRSEFLKSHVPKAINMPVRYSEVLRDHVIDDPAPLGTDKNARIVVYGGANDPAAAAVVRQATAEGYTNVIWMRGGLAEWVSARLPTASS